MDAKRVTYRYMAGYHAGMDAFTTLITVAALVSGAMFLASGSISATDLVTFLLYINNFTEPVTKLVTSLSSSRTATAVTTVSWK